MFSDVENPADQFPADVDQLSSTREINGHATIISLSENSRTLGRDDFLKAAASLLECIRRHTFRVRYGYGNTCHNSAQFRVVTHSETPGTAPKGGHHESLIPSENSQ